MIKYIIFTLTFILSSCAVQKNQLKRRNLEEFYKSTGTVSYLLPEYPQWSNTSLAGQCSREYSVQYIDFNKLQNNLNFSYYQALQFQVEYNLSIRKEKKKIANGYIPLEKSEKIFHKVSEKIHAGIYPLKKTDFKRIHFVFVSNLNKLKKLIQRDDFSQGYPVFISLCLSQESLRKMVYKAKFNGKFSVVGIEMLSVYFQKKKLYFAPSINIEEIFENHKKYLYLPQRGKIPQELIGNFKYRYY